MKLFVAPVLLLGYLFLIVTSNEDEITSSRDGEALVEAPNPSTTDISNSSQHQGPKAKVKNVLNKVKQTFKEVGGEIKRFNFRYKHRNQDTSTSNYDSATVLWIVFGAIGGGIILMGTYYFIRMHAKS